MQATQFAENMVIHNSDGVSQQEWFRQQQV